MPEYNPDETSTPTGNDDSAGSKSDDTLHFTIGAEALRRIAENIGGSAVCSVPIDSMSGLGRLSRNLGSRVGTQDAYDVTCRSSGKLRQALGMPEGDNASWTTDARAIRLAQSNYDKQAVERVRQAYTHSVDPKTVVASYITDAGSQASKSFAKTIRAARDAVQDHDSDDENEPWPEIPPSLSESLGSRRGQLLLDELLRPYEREGSTIITPDILTMVGEKGERLLPGCFAGLTSMPISNEASIDSSYFDSRVLVDAATTAFYEELTALTKACAQLYE